MTCGKAARALAPPRGTRDERRWQKHVSRSGISRVIVAAKKAGLPIGGIEVNVEDGTIRVLTTPPADQAQVEPNDWDVGWEVAERKRRSEAEDAFRSAARRLTRADVSSLFKDRSEVTKRTAAKLLGVAPDLLDHASRFGLLPRTRIGGEARFIETALCAAIWPDAIKGRGRG